MTFEKLTEIINNFIDLSAEETALIQRHTSQNWFATKSKSGVYEHFVSKEGVVNSILAKTVK